MPQLPVSDRGLFWQERARWEREFLVDAIERYGSVAKAAETLGLNRTYFYKLLGLRGVSRKRQKFCGNWAMFGL